jgi:DNA mismatch repair protein MutS2
VAVSFRVSQKTLERLEWRGILEQLADCARTPLARARLLPSEGSAETVPGLFEASPAEVHQRLEETAEARAILAEGDRPPLGDASDVSASLERALKGGLLQVGELQDLLATLLAVRGTARFLALRRDRAPRLAELAATLCDHGDLAARIEGCLEPSGELRDSASPGLAAARAEARRLAGEIQGRLARRLQDPETASRLSDAYYTLRNDRYVLPVRADLRASIPGIVHDASRTGTTVFIEPEELVELNNRHKQAEIAVQQETARILRDLSSGAARAASAVAGDLSTLAAIDLAFARADLADAMDASRPEVGDAGVLRLPQLRHPALDREHAVPNDLRLGEGATVLVLSGPNAGGKTVTMKAVALAVLLVRCGLFVPAAPGARVDLFDRVLADIGDEQDIRENLSTFSAHMANLARIVDAADARSLVVLDELGVGTDPGEGAALAQSLLEALADAGARAIVTTHYNLLKEMAEADPRFENASVEFDAETLEPTYRLRQGMPGSSSATAVAARMGLRGDVIERANALLDREDRRLDRMLAELSASRAALEREQSEARRLSAQSQAARDEYRGRLERLEGRRDELYRSMRADLDRAFRAAHERVADVIRELQRGGTARDAARARERLMELETRAKRTEPATPRASPAGRGTPVDWRNARAGDAVRLPGGGSGVLVALPDRRGRVALRVGGARLLVPADRVEAVERAAEQPAARAPRGRVAHPRRDDAARGGRDRCDLRGLRVDEALDRLVAALDRAVAEARDELEIVHGVGTGALRRAVREHLASSPYVSAVIDPPPEQGGDGVSVARLVE